MSNHLRADARWDAKKICAGAEQVALAAAMAKPLTEGRASRLIYGRDDTEKREAITLIVSRWPFLQTLCSLYTKPISPIEQKKQASSSNGGKKMESELLQRGSDSIHIPPKKTTSFPLPVGIGSS